MYKLAVFDLDGTLLDTLEDLASSVNFALREMGFPQRTTEQVRGFIGNGVKKLIERSVPRGTDKKSELKCLDIFTEHYLSHMYDTTAAFEGVSRLLEELKAQGVKTAVVSNKLHSAVEELCLRFFPGLIDIALGVSCEKERKPAPVNVIRALDYFSCDRYSAVFVGDSETDVLTAHNAGLAVIGVTWGFRSRRELIDSSADFIADTAQEVKNIILN